MNMKRKYVKTFENEDWRNLVNKSDTNWTITVSANTDKLGMDDNVLEEALNSMRHPYQVKFFKKMNDKLLKDYAGSTAEWQTRKALEVEEAFLNGLEVKFLGDQVLVNFSYNISYPDDWDKGTVVDWSPGILSILQAYLFVYTEKLAKEYRKHKTTGEESREEYDKIRGILKSLMKAQKWTVTNGTDVWEYDTPNSYEWVKTK